VRLVLASASPRRAELLATAGFQFETLPVDVDERVKASETPAEYVRRLASEKSARALQLLETQAAAGHAGSATDEVVILGADTAVVVDNRIFGKPRDDENAREMLRSLSGRSHQVVTAVSLRSRNEERVGLETTDVWIANLTANDLDWYVSTGEGRDKAGAYAIQGLASRLIPRIEGSYSNVVGLPLALVNQLLKSFRVG
jgi:septum formation protein